MRRARAGQRDRGSRYYRQDLAQVPIDDTLYDIIADLRPALEPGADPGSPGPLRLLRRHGAATGGTLSGGERARVALAMLMLSGANLLIFDEPTNHLDVESIEALEDAIDEYDGTVLLVSHDRALLRALATRMWVLHGDPDHRFRRQLRRVGDGERRAGPCGSGRGGGRGAPPADARRNSAPDGEPAGSAEGAAEPSGGRCGDGWKRQRSEVAERITDRLR